MDFKALKADLQEIYTVLQDQIGAGEMPLDSDLQRFVRLSRQLLGVAEDEWLGECEDFVHLSEQLLLAVKNNQIQDTVLILESLDDAVSYCHRTYQG